MQNGVRRDERGGKRRNTAQRLRQPLRLPEVRAAGLHRFQEGERAVPKDAALVAEVGVDPVLGRVSSVQRDSARALLPTVQTGSPSSGDSAPDMEASPGEPGAAGDTSTNDSREVLIVVVQEGDRVWSYQHWYGEDRVLDALPEGCRSLGRVGVYAEGEDCVYTDMGEFPDAPLWIAGEDMEGPVYLELPEGGYLECRRA